ncbi:hypothetical protein [Ralstonia wenshanensis]|uniref:Uncharacterized protein n=1 Tax=Ralstonia wenshanensis TaxID=2842456 RepID=A0AAD2AXE0_9RALS|nr:hypothetical protein [Ralstonia wenshanensis]CAJ0692593.1 hypothetical protein LMG18091_01638 [Ralstonia wenshanensis]
MPNILVKIPANTFDGDARATLARRITEAAAQAEQIPPDPRKRATTWVVSTRCRPAHGGAAGRM